MSEDAKTAPTNGNGKDSAKRVAANLYKLCDELADNGREIAHHQIRIIGLAKVIERAEVPFGVEQIEKVADVIKEAGDIAHSRGSIFYDRADKIRKVSEGE